MIRKLAIGLAVDLITAVIVMWCFELVHQDVPAIPAIGYGASFAIVMLASIASKLIQGGRDA